MPIRQANDADAAAIASIYNHYIDQGCFTMDTRHWPVAEVQRRIAGLADREQLLVATHNQDIIGWGIVKQYSDRHGYRVSCETSLYVHPQFTGYGLGSHLIRVLFDVCRQFGYRHVVARIRASNAASIRFHERHGFEFVGRQREVGFVQGRWEDVVILQRIFPEVRPPAE